MNKESGNIIDSCGVNHGEKLFVALPACRLAVVAVVQWSYPQWWKITNLRWGGNHQVSLFISCSSKWDKLVIWYFSSLHHQSRMTSSGFVLPESGAWLQQVYFYHTSYFSFHEHQNISSIFAIADGIVTWDIWVRKFSPHHYANEKLPKVRDILRYGISAWSKLQL